MALVEGVVGVLNQVLGIFLLLAFGTGLEGVFGLLVLVSAADAGRAALLAQHPRLRVGHLAGVAHAGAVLRDVVVGAVDGAVHLAARLGTASLAGGLAHQQGFLQAHLLRVGAKVAALGIGVEERVVGRDVDLHLAAVLGVSVDEHHVPQAVAVLPGNAVGTGQQALLDGGIAGDAVRLRTANELAVRPLVVERRVRDGEHGVGVVHFLRGDDLGRFPLGLLRRFGGQRGGAHRLRRDGRVRALTEGAHDQQHQHRGQPDQRQQRHQDIRVLAVAVRAPHQPDAQRRHQEQHQPHHPRVIVHILQQVAQAVLGIFRHVFGRVVIGLAAIVAVVLDRIAVLVVAVRPAALIAVLIAVVVLIGVAVIVAIVRVVIAFRHIGLFAVIGGFVSARHVGLFTLIAVEQLLALLARVQAADAQQCHIIHPFGGRYG